MTNAELRKELVEELNKKNPNQERISLINKKLDDMQSELESRVKPIFTGEFLPAVPMEDCKA